MAQNAGDNAKVFDFKKEYRDLYMPADKPVLIEVPSMNFLMVDGSGDPNGNPVFEKAVEVLYGLSYSVKMSKMKGLQPDGFYEYVVPPLEGLWWIEGGGFSLDARDNWKWTIMIRQPEFVNEGVFRQACCALSEKKPSLSLKGVRFQAFSEGLCVQIMHKGPYATEPVTMSRIDGFIKSEGLRDLLGEGGKHHEIYLSDPRKGKPENMRTVLRHPVGKPEGSHSYV